MISLSTPFEVWWCTRRSLVTSSRATTFDYDYVVIGGGSGGLSSAKAAADAGAKVAVFDYVEPTVHGTKWGLGGTCVNVGCIPKKLMHATALMGEVHRDMHEFGWEISPEKKINWEKLVEAVQNHIKSVNFAYKIDLRTRNATYINSLARFKDPHTVEYEEKGVVKQLTSRYFLVAVGGRPNYPDIPGALHAITSDDIFSLQNPPGKTLAIGGSYVSLECAGFLTGLGYDATVMIRSIPLRGFDQQMAEKIVNYMENYEKTRFIRHAVPVEIKKLDNNKFQVFYDQNGEIKNEEFDTVLMAIGRTALTKDIGLDKAGVVVNPSNRKLIVNTADQTNVPHIFAVGDCANGVQELTPVAVLSGKLLAERLFGNKKTLMDYINVPTTVFTPIEYGSVGYSEEAAVATFGADNIEVYHMQATPYEHIPIYEREEYPAYLKLICNKKDNERVLGLHVVGPNAGEITQGFAVAIKLGATKAAFDSTVGIHPTTAELFCTLSITKRSGKPLPKGGCPSCA